MLPALRALVVLTAFVCPLAADVVRASEVLAIPRLRENTLVFRGNASFYADRFHGKPTASGELLDQNCFTAASRSLPFGTRATVTNLRTGKSVEVRINDRGPYSLSRVIDVSKRAADALDMSAHGVAPVRVEVSAEDQPTAELREEIAARLRLR